MEGAAEGAGQGQAADGGASVEGEPEGDSTDHSHGALPDNALAAPPDAEGPWESRPGEFPAAPSLGASGLPQVLPGLGQAQPAQLSREEIASAFSYFTGTQGYRNSLNVLTPDLLQARLGPVLTMSLHYCEGLLRAPYGTSKPAADSQGPKASLTPAQAAEIMAYRVSPSDDVDLAAESFLLLGARSADDELPMEAVAELLSRAYEGMEDQVSGSSEYAEVCERVYQQEEALHKIRAKQDAENGLPVQKYTRHDQIQDRDYQMVSERDVIDVLRMCVGDKDTINLEDWRALYSSLAGLDFLDYRKEIQRAMR